MDDKDMQVLIDTFRGYRDLLQPVYANLNDFIDTYDAVKDDIAKLSTALNSDVSTNLQKIYQNLSVQAEKASDLASRIEQFIQMSNKYTAGINSMLSIFEKMEKRVVSINQIEDKANDQLARLDVLLEEKKKSYNIKDLEKSLESYNNNVQKVGDFINKDVGAQLAVSNEKLQEIKRGNENISKQLSEENGNIEQLLKTYTASTEVIKKMVEGEDVNEAYMYDILDKWATERKVKIRK